MGFFAKSFFRGIAAIVPIAVTIYILWWFLSGAETLLENLFPLNPAFEKWDQVSLPKPEKRLYYQPGLGIAAGVVITVVVGVLLNNWLIRWFMGLGVAILERVPLVKTLYRMLNDMVSFFAHTDEKEFNQVVMVRPVKDGPEMLGFLTRSNWDGMPEGFGGPGKVGVYLPMSYQIGGYLLVMDREDVRPIEMEMEDALRITLAAGISTSNSKKS
jgi:uncharacterized membrane protein